MVPVHQELDDWAYEIEKNYENGERVNKTKHLKLCRLRDKYCKEHLDSLYKDKYNIEIDIRDVYREGSKRRQDRLKAKQEGKHGIEKISDR